jgi:hydrogenase small subunit
MAQQEGNIAMYEELEARGVTRRDFLRFCGGVAAMLGLSEAMVPQIASAIEQGAKLKPAIWLSQGLCTGCTESMAQSFYPDAGQIVLDILSMNYWETLSAGAGESVEGAIADTVAKYPKKFILIVEGAIMNGFGGNALRVAGKPAVEEFKKIAEAAEAILAVGSCAVDGGWVMAKPNPAGATGVMQTIGKEKVINLPTCPVNPEWVVAMIVDFLFLGRAPVMDSENRPTLIYGQTIHDNCPRRGHFENGEFVEAFGSAEEAKNYCLYKMGCKGPQTKSQCPIVRWNARTSWCVEAGSPCIGCANFNWVDNDAPFLSRQSGTLPVSPQTIGLVLGGAALAGLVVHGIAQTATGRMGKGAPLESADETPAAKKAAAQVGADSKPPTNTDKMKGGDDK